MKSCEDDLMSGISGTTPTDTGSGRTPFASSLMNPRNPQEYTFLMDILPFPPTLPLTSKLNSVLSSVNIERRKVLSILSKTSLTSGTISMTESGSFPVFSTLTLTFIVIEAIILLLSFIGMKLKLYMLYMIYTVS